MSDSFETPSVVVLQAPLSMKFLMQEYQSGLPLPSPGDLPDPGTEPVSPALAGGFFTTGPRIYLRRATVVQESGLQGDQTSQS